MSDTNEICRNCRFFDWSGWEDQGECRRHAPQPAVITDEQIEGYAEAMAVWPNVGPYAWCGEWQPGRKS